MTDNNTQPDLARHESEYELQQTDVDDITGLIAVVGRELTTIDKFAGGQMQKATKLSQQKIFNKRPVAVPQPSSNSVSPEPVTDTKKPSSTLDKQLEQLKSDVMQKKPLAKTPAAVVESQPSSVVSDLKRIEKKLDNLTNIFDNILKKLTSNTKNITLTINDSKD